MADGWDCPYCNRVATLSKDNISRSAFAFTNNNKLGTLHMGIKTITCPNPACREFVISAILSHAIRTPNGFEAGAGIQAWQLRPQSKAKTFPDYIPVALREDYSEACLIRDLSPKASATLSRRCLQGMIRNFWNVEAPNLYQEINAIKDKVDPATWEAMDAVRSIGNIGAHMEKDINLVIDVDPDEAQTLIQLIEMLFEEWYIRRKQREERLAGIVAIADAKKAAKAPKPAEGSASDSPEVA
jgi:hypothetical protein